ncbi:MAG: RagB/SusD family nutrient uptake outer membrane protein [Prevotella sp.]|nr:RagB/SusD family nutrient uptake outer membrane protein [Prevotella sp.]
MKNIFKTAIFAAGVLGLAACSDFLDQRPPSDLRPEEMWSSPEAAELGINKLYGMMTDNTYGQQIPILFGTGTDYELIDGLGTESLNTTSERGNMNYNYSTAWTTLNTAWNNIYSLINNCNIAIKSIRESGSTENGSVEDQAKMKRFLGEVLTIRAMAYLDLTRMWGDVPFRTDENMDSNYEGKTDRDVIQDACIKDLKEAVNYLPWAGEGVTTEHATKGYAYGLLAQTALTRAGYSIRESAKAGYENLGDTEGEPLKSYCDATYPTQRPDEATRKEYYKIAAEAAAEVIKSGRHQLNPSFEDEWKMINQLRLDQTYQENIFEIPNGMGVTGELGYTVGKRINGATRYFGTKGNSSGKLKLTGELWQTYHSTGRVMTESSRPTNNIAASYKALDTRRDVTLTLFQYREGTGFKYYNVTHPELLFYEDNTSKGPFGFYCGKWNPEWWTDALKSVAKNAGDAKWNTGINVVRMRYSQILLNYAEACYLLGGAGYKIDGAPTALEALTEVHCRAYETENKAAGKDFIEEKANADFMEAIYAENAWEFAGEGVRKWELIRWGQLSHKIVEAKKNYIEGVYQQPSRGGYPRSFYYRFKTVDLGNGIELLAADPATFCWGENWPTYPDDSKAATNNDCMTQKWFAHGDNASSEANKITNLPSICDGLNPWSNIPEASEKPHNFTLFNTQTNTTVRNRYIMPIGAITVSASNGNLANSYGY